MLIVPIGTKHLATELGGRHLRCPACGGVLRPWGYGRERVVRNYGAYQRFRPRRTRCASCRLTHVLLPDQTLLRRLDHVEAIGSALAATATGAGYRKVARRLDVPPSTVRHWISRFVVRAPDLLASTPALAPLAPNADRRALIRAAVEALGRSADEAAPPGVEFSWQRVSLTTTGSFLAPRSRSICGGRRE